MNIRFLWLSVGLCVASLALFTLALVFRVQDQNRLDQIATSTNEALCALKQDLQRRYDSGTEFLASNPDGIPGITRATIQQSLENQRRTLLALRQLDCE
jgi:hypothetical protein